MQLQRDIAMGRHEASAVRSEEVEAFQQRDRLDLRQRQLIQDGPALAADQRFDSVDQTRPTPGFHEPFVRERAVLCKHPFLRSREDVKISARVMQQHLALDTARANRPDAELPR